MAGKIIINVLLISFLAVFQISFISALPLRLDRLNLLIIAVIFIIASGGFRLAVWWAAGAGILLDIFSFLPFGAHLASSLVMVIAANLLASSFFTNRSLYSFLALTLSALLSYKIFLYPLAILSDFLDRRESVIDFGSAFFAEELIAIALNFLAVCVAFYAFIYLSKKFRPMFLLHRRDGMKLSE